MTKKLTAYERITNQMIDAMETATGSYECPWNKNAAAGLPVNYVTKKQYNGVNLLMLWVAAFNNEFTSNEWMTFKQAQSVGGQIRKGSKGVQIVRWIFRKTDTVVTETEEGEETRIKEKSIPICKVFTVFNRNQIDGLPEMEVTVVNAEQRKMNIEAFVATTGASILHGGNRASYRPATDVISMPEYTQFKCADAYYSTLFHELGHWTGNERRLDRDLTGRFGSEAYAMEELVAELTSAFLCAEFGLTNELQHAEYLANWVTVMKADPYAVFTASREATKAADLLKGVNAKAEVNESPSVEVTA